MGDHLKCKRCGYQWRRRSDKKPSKCPTRNGCGSTLWNTDRCINWPEGLKAKQHV